MRYSAVAATIPVIVGIVLSGSRTGMLCAAIVLAVRFSGAVRRWKYLRRSVPLLALLLLAGLYLLKKDSADGRLLVWRCSLEMIIDKPLFGHGPGGFTAEYMNYQADYFRTHPDSPYAQLADSVHHPFNEYLLAAVDYGCLGLLVLIVSGAAIVRRYRRAAGGDPIIRAPVRACWQSGFSPFFRIRFSILSLGQWHCSACGSYSGVQGYPACCPAF